MSAKLIEIELNIMSSGQSRRGVLVGSAQIEAGFLSGSIIPEGVAWTHAEKVMATAFTFTGCPIAARTRQPELNPWLVTKGSYESVRTLETNEFRVISRIQARGTDERVSMTLNLDIDGAMPDVVSIAEPFQEYIRQIRTGQLEGEFAIKFLTSGGRMVQGVARSDYRLAVTSHVAPVWRNITILTAPSGQGLMQIEQIDLYGDRSEAAADLAGRLRTSIVH